MGINYNRYCGNNFHNWMGELMNHLSEARIKANKKWDNNNKVRKQYLNRRSVTKNFILKEATAEDIANIEEFVIQRKKLL